MTAEPGARVPLALGGAIVLASLVLAWRAIHVNAVLYGPEGRPRLEAPLAAVLARNPAEVAALLMLARDREAAGDRPGASRAYHAALEVAPHEPEALLLAGDFFLRERDPAAVELVARLAAPHGAERERAFAALAALLATGREAEAVRNVLARKPAWLPAFALDACGRGLDPARLAPWLRRAEGDSWPPETTCAIDRLRGEGRWSEAYQVWLNALPQARLRRVGHVFNGDFEHAASGAGFDWSLQRRAEREAGHSAATLQTLGASGTRALRVAYTGGRQSEAPARQYLALEPGRYELSGRARPEGVKSLRGVHWTVRCASGAESGRILGASERFLGSSEWRPFKAPVEVPAGCPGQLLQLEPVAEPDFVSGTAWFDDLAVARR